MQTYYLNSSLIRKLVSGFYLSDQMLIATKQMKGIELSFVVWDWTRVSAQKGSQENQLMTPVHVSEK